MNQDITAPLGRSTAPAAGTPGPIDQVDVLDASAVARINPEATKLADYPALDWLRFVLASIVLLNHSAVRFPGRIDGGLAVDVFLALSGWLIGGILLRTRAHELPRFFYNRSTRIWAPYALTVVLIYGLAAVKEGIDVHWFKYLFYDATFTHYTFTRFPQALTEMPLGGTGNHLWSISVEEQFYLAAPLIIIFLPVGRTVWMWVAISAVLMAMPSRFSPIALGVLAAIVHTHVPLATGRWPRHLAMLAAALGVLVVMSWYDHMALHALFGVLLVLGLTMPGRRTRLGILAGAVSYPLYLNQSFGAFMVNAAAHVLPPLGHAGTVAATYFAALLVACMAWLAVDKQVMARRAGWFTPARGRLAMIAAYSLIVIGLVGGGLIWMNEA